MIISIELCKSLLATECGSGPGHEGEAVCYFCLEPGCTARRLGCPICLHSLHQGHKSVPLKLYLARAVGFNSSKEEIEELVGYAMVIAQGKALAKEILRDEESRCIHDFVYHYFNRLELHLLEIDRISKLFNNLSEEKPPSPAELERQLLELYYHEGQLRKSADSKAGMVKRLKRLRFLLAYKYPYKSILIRNLLCDKEQQTRISFLSSDLACACISVENNVVKKSKDNKSGVALVQPALNLFGWDKKGVGFKILNCGDIRLGICQRQSLQKLKFELPPKIYEDNPTSMTLPLVVLSNYGYSWNSMTSQQNSQYTSFNYQVGDVVYLVFNPTTRSLAFSQGELSYSLSVPRLEDQDWHFAVLLNGVGNSVQLINDVPAHLFEKY